MKNGLDITMDVISLINIPEVNNQISGRIWPSLMPGGRTGTDIVVSCYTATNQQIQQASVNINIHIPNAQFTIDNKVSQMPVQPEFLKIARLILPYLDTQYKPDFYTEVIDPGVLIRDTDGSYYFNILLKYRSIQDNYKNI